MIVYDGVSSIDWFYDGTMTAKEMKEEERFSGLFSEKCVLYDNGRGKVYRWEPLSSAYLRFAANIDADGMVADMEDPAFEPVRKRIDAAKSAAEAAQAKAEQAVQASNQQVISLAKMQVATMSFESETDIASVNTLLPYWDPDSHPYKQGDAFQWDGRAWRVSQDTTSQSIYPPGVSESLYYEIVIADDGIIVYRQAHGQYDSVRLGELRHYPDADSPVYRSKVDYNAYSPDTVPDNWELVDGEPTEPDEGETTTEPEEPSDEPTEPTIPEFIQPTGAHDAYGIGDRVTYNGKVYESTMAGNAYSPDAYPQGWKLVE